MKAAKFFSFSFILLLVISCGPKDNKTIRLLKGQTSETQPLSIPLDKGFSEFISWYTSGIIPVNSAIEIRFSPGFAAKANKSASGLFVFEPAIRGKAEWKDETTLVFTPSRLLESGKTYTGTLNLGKLSEVKDRLKTFPLRIETLKKDFRVTTGGLECFSSDGKSYLFHGEITASDYIESGEVENYLSAKLGRKRLEVKWDHSGNFLHKFTITGIDRSKSAQELELKWDGTQAGVKQKGSSSITIPPEGEFSILDVITPSGESQRIDIIFSDPVDASKETDGLIRLS